MQGLAIQIGKSVAPTLSDLTQKMQAAVIWTVGFIKENETLVKVVGISGGVITGLGVALAGLGAAITATTIGIKGLTVAWAFFTGAVAFFLRTPTGAVLLALGILAVKLAEKFDLLSLSIADAGGEIENLKDPNLIVRKYTQVYSRVKQQVRLYQLLL